MLSVKRLKEESILRDIRSFFFVENGTYMMDTPGFSSMYIEDLEPNELKDYFPEFSEYEEECRF